MLSLAIDGSIILLLLFLLYIGYYAGIIIFLVGIFIFKIVKFLYLSIFDKLAGACLGFFLWLILSVNVIIPSLDVYANQIQSKIEKTTSIISKLSKVTLPIFGKYIPSFIDNKKIKNIQNYMLF